MPIMPHIDTTGMPHWLRIVVVVILIAYVAAMIAGAISLGRRGK